MAVPILTELTRVSWEHFSCRDVILVDIRAKYVIRSLIYILYNLYISQNTWDKKYVEIFVKIFAYKEYLHFSRSKICSF